MTNLSYSGSSLPEVKWIQHGHRPQACRREFVTRSCPAGYWKNSEVISLETVLSLECPFFGLSDASLLSRLL